LVVLVPACARARNMSATYILDFDSIGAEIPFAMERVRLTIVLLVLSVICTTGCLFRSHTVQQKLSPVPLKKATQEELIAKINQMTAAVQTMSATVDIDTTVGGEKKGKVTEYQQIRGYILLQKPAMLRMIGLLPIVRNRAFDMVSDGEQFKLSIPPKNRFIVGNNQVTKLSDNALENLRPQVIYEALLMPAINTQNEIAVIEQGKQQVQDEHTQKTISVPNYHIVVIRRDAKGEWHLHRKIYFSRTDLEPYRQTIYDDKGAIATDVTYSDPQDYDGQRFPSLIAIERPQEEYSITIKMVKLTLNEPLKPDQFQLEAPAGATVTELK
jgi:outer membrane lipoprotein-sorting protein